MKDWKTVPHMKNMLENSSTVDLWNQKLAIKTIKLTLPSTLSNLLIQVLSHRISGKYMIWSLATFSPVVLEMRWELNLKLLLRLENSTLKQATLLSNKKIISKYILSIDGYKAIFQAKFLRNFKLLFNWAKIRPNLRAIFHNLT